MTVCAPAAEQAAFGEADRRIEGYALPVEEAGARYVVVSTQGRGDEAALLAALAVDVDYVAFVGSRKKAEALKAALASAAFPPSAWRNSRRRPASISAPSRRTKSRSRSSRKSSRCGAAPIRAARRGFAASF